LYQQQLSESRQQECIDRMIQLAMSGM